MCHRRRTCTRTALGFLALLLVFPGPAPAQERTWTLDADFDEGSPVNVNHELVHDQLQINEIADIFPFIWVAASNRGTIVKIDVDTGEVLGEYLSAPDRHRYNPSRTTVDRNGDVWVGNRHPANLPTGSVVKLGLIQGGSRVDAGGSLDPDGGYLMGPFVRNNCVDRDGDGLIRTSRGLGDILPWPDNGDSAGSDCTGGDTPAVQDAEDECILIYQQVTGNMTRHLAVDLDNDIWVGAWRGDVHATDHGHEFDHLDGETGCILLSREFDCGGYGGFVDCYGILWSAGRIDHLLRYDPQTDTPQCLDVPGSYGLGLDTRGFIWNSRFTHEPADDNVRKIDRFGNIVGRFPTLGDNYDRGVAVSRADDHVWVANSGGRGGTTVTRLDNDGRLCEVIQVGLSPTGVAVDPNGKVWVTNRYSDNVSRIRPAPVSDPPDPALPCGGLVGASVVDLVVDLDCQTARPALCAADPGNPCCTTDANPYNYSDMTGMISLSNPPFGRWSASHDTGAVGIRWGVVSWNSDEPAGTSLTVTARVAETAAGLTAVPFQPVNNGVHFGPAAGRFIEVHVEFTVEPRSHCDGFISPVLFDITVTPELFLSLDPLGGCYKDPVVVLTGSVESGGDVERIYYTVNGGAERNHCADCGEDPVYAIPVTMEECDNDIVVTAEDRFYSKSATTRAKYDGEGPRVACPPPLRLECNTPGGVDGGDPAVQAWLSGVTADDNCDGAVPVTHDAPAFYPSGCEPGQSTTVTFSSVDACGNPTECTGTVTVVDTTPPVLTPPPPITIECNTEGGVAGDDPAILAWLARATADDLCGSVAGIWNDAPSFFPSGCDPQSGTTPVNFFAEDECRNQATAPSGVTVLDTTPPQVLVDVLECCLWPPNHKFVGAARFRVEDICDLAAGATGFRVTSDEHPSQELGAGGPNHCPDARWGPSGILELRAERSGVTGRDNGRVYGLVGVEASDRCGNIGTGAAASGGCLGCPGAVCVPHDQSPRSPGQVPGNDPDGICVAIDDGQRYDAADDRCPKTLKLGGAAPPPRIR